jgi:hypothetical protein
MDDEDRDMRDQERNCHLIARFLEQSPRSYRAQGPSSAYLPANEL